MGWPPRPLGQRISTTPPSFLNRQSKTSRAGPGRGSAGLVWNSETDETPWYSWYSTQIELYLPFHIKFTNSIWYNGGHKRLDRGETLETEGNGDSKRTNERDPFLVGSLCLSCRCKLFLLCLGCSSRPSTKYLVPHPTLFPNLCDHRPTSWACSHAGSPVSYCVSLVAIAILCISVGWLPMISSAVRTCQRGQEVFNKNEVFCGSFKCFLWSTLTGLIYIFFLKFFFGKFFFSYCIQHCFICRPSDSLVPTDAGIEPRTVATGTMAVRRSNH